MADNRPSIGYGATFQIHDDSSPGSYTTIGYVTNITPPGPTRDAVDVTNSGSANGWRTFVPGLRDGGETSFEIVFVPNSAGVTLIYAELDRDQPSQCKITLPGATAYSWTFDAIITGIEPTAPIDDKMSATVTLKITGKPTLAAGS